MRKRSTRPAPGAMAAWGLTLAAVMAAPVVAEEAGADPATEAVALYDAGRYAEAQEILERLDAAGGLDGPLLYRLSFCLGAMGDRPAQQAALTRAIATLEQELGGASSLEPAFYLANALRNLNRRAEAREVAIQATGRIESGDWTPSDDPLESFRAGKLYADLGRQDDATRWYRRALEGFDADPQAYPVYIRWARGYLGSLAFSRADFAAAEAELAALAATGQAGQAEWDRLAVTRVRLGKWQEAADAWRRAERANPAEADRARYSYRLAEAAAKLDAVPDATPDGRAFLDLGQADLETLMKEQATRVLEIMARAAAESLTDEDRAALAAELEAIRPVFVAAGLEYTARQLPIRETAFFGGYAPLIFHDDRWRLPEPPPEPQAEP